MRAGAENAEELDFVDGNDWGRDVRLHAELVLGEDQVAVLLRASPNVDVITGLHEQDVDRPTVAFK